MAFNKVKTDPVLGREVHEYLVKMGVETPFIENSISRSDKIELIEAKFTDIMTVLGLDLTDDSLQDTPKRVAKMFVNETLWGLEVEAFPKCTTVANKMGYDEMVVEKGISVQSQCEHHWVNIDGIATVAYIPHEKVLGLSKMNRIVEYFSRRPQIQERQTEQVFHALTYILNTQDVAVLIDAKHFCVKSRGVEDAGCSTITSKLGGGFKTDAALRAEFMGLARSSMTHVH
jgi:GTP cyclohydrolase I